MPQASTNPDEVVVFVTYAYGSNLRHAYSVVRAPTLAQAMEHIHTVTQGRYAFTYTNVDDFARQIEEFHLVNVPLQPQRTV